MTDGNVSVVVNYDGHGPNDPPGYVQFTRSGDRVFIVVDRKSIGSMDYTEFTRVQKLFNQKGCE